jgi:hypothetical protein
MLVGSYSLRHPDEFCSYARYSPVDLSSERVGLSNQIHLESLHQEPCHPIGTGARSSCLRSSVRSRHFRRVREKCISTNIFPPFFPSGCSLIKYGDVIGIFLSTGHFSGKLRFFLTFSRLDVPYISRGLWKRVLCRHGNPPPG